MKSWLALVSFGVITGFAVSAVADDDRNHDRQKRVFRAQLVSLNEVPSVSTPARGEFYAIVNDAGTAFTYWLTYSGLAFDASQSHIHFGQHHTNGGISVWLCEGTVAAPAGVAANVPPCATRATTMPITATDHGCRRDWPGGPGHQRRRFCGAPSRHAGGRGLRERALGRGGDATGPPVVAAIGFPGGEIRGQIN